jgi:hypothetical protein
MGLTAVVTTLAGRSFEVPVTNLTSRSLFVRTAQPLTFGDDVILSLFGQTTAAVVAFVAHQPRGAVLVMTPTDKLEAAIEKHQESVEVMAAPPVDADAWREITNTEALLADALPEPDDRTHELTAPPEAGDGPAIEQRSSPAAEGPTTDPRVDPEPPNAAVARIGLVQRAGLGPSDRDAVRDPVGDPATRAARDPARIPARDAARPEAARDPARPEAARGAARPEAARDAARPEAAPPRPDPAPRRPSSPPSRPSLSVPEPRTDPAGSETEDDSPVPRLERDGYTVRFGSRASYRAQHDSHLEHGGLVVRAPPMKVGEQKMLVLDVPGCDRYTVSARVVFNQPGQVGFMLDSFSLHRDRLRRMAEADR